jgi:AcrR family transcriptional regulator
MPPAKRQPDPPPARPDRDLPVADPAANLSPTARRILAAARRVLLRDGFGGLTFDAISAEAGENRALIRYYFGNKGGLVTALVDWMDHKDTLALVKRLAAGEQERENFTVLLRLQRDNCKAVRENRLFYDLVPHILRDPAMRKRLAGMYKWYREFDGRVLAPDAAPQKKAEAERLASLAIAVYDGMILQRACDPAFDVDAAYETWERLMRSALEELDGESWRTSATEPGEADASGV